MLSETEYKHYENYFFKNFIKELEQREDKIYHYTNINGLEGILKKDGAIWVSHADFLNDKTEIKYTMELSTEIFLSLCEKRDFSQEKISKYQKLYVEAININNRMNTNYYSLSFSTNPDSNLLWANYSHNDGYSITFDFDKLYSQLLYEMMINNNVAIGSKVIYKQSVQRAKLSKLLNIIIDNFEEKTKKENYDVNKDELILNAVGVLEWYSVFFKDECFSQEEEFRIALLYLNNNDSKIYDCRISNGTFIPYVKINVNRDSVRGVIIGPKNNMDINKEGLSKFLQKHDYDLTKVSISKSKIPYRY
ncbi:DUF2971 domain-containing protein [Bacillus safensis]|uniref:DUF2971 domain-containing protein n=2 Tax=Bacillus safensis TaxID=561879 RepID=UPI000C787B42|nr:DUF2971 domain-containing protein [Bacillus safensis]PLT38319.1 hypothetical protein CUU65_07745 [Bacillus safensis]